MPTKTYRYVTYNPETGALLVAHHFTESSPKQLRPFHLPSNAVDLTDNPELFQAVRANLSGYKVVDGELVENQN